jgi:ATP-dependent RNA helicase MSS116
LENETSAFLDQVDRDAIREVFVSLLGYYFVKASDMRVTRRSIYEGLQAWSTEAFGLPKALFVSDALLAKMGGLDGGAPALGSQRGPSRQSFGLKPPATRYMNGDQNRRRNEWMDRGASRSRAWQHRGEDEHKNTRFGSKFSDWGSRSRREDGRQRDGEWHAPSRSRRDRGDDPF